MGHRSIQVTVDVSGHLVPGGDRAAVDRLDDTSLGVTQASPDAAPDEGGADVSLLESMVSRVGIEPTTRRLRVLSRPSKPSKN